MAPALVSMPDNVRSDCVWLQVPVLLSLKMPLSFPRMHLCGAIDTPGNEPEDTPVSCIDIDIDIV